MATKALPEVEVYARPFGYLQWICPNCQEIFGAKQISGRKARIRCTNCARVYRLGLSFGEGANLPAPYGAKFMGQFNGYTTNRLGDQFPPNMIARFRGRLDWCCPFCGLFHSSPVGRDRMDVRCYVCNQIFYINVLFYAGLTGNPVRCPLDWSVPFEASSSSLNSLPPPTTGTCQ